MKPELEHLPLVKNDEKNRFELENNGRLAFIEFEERDHFIALTHTEAAAELAGTGTAVALVEKTLHYIEESGKQLMPYCPYVFAFIKKHPEWKRIVSPKFPAYDKL
ncbi:GNAT family N-acetyltransferase [Capnocytophaga canimorsus]|uniref:GNAT family N-acetyltransferase n=1 Tax=Capnocytophaga canimorsus TaxID=28188 RepID=UPI00385C93B3